MVFTREELTDISTRARMEAEFVDLNPLWRYAYQTLACAADHLDAMIARCEVKEDKQVHKE